MARLTVGVAVIAALTVPMGMSIGASDSPALYLVDDSIDDGSPDPPYDPSPSGSSADPEESTSSDSEKGSGKTKSPQAADEGGLSLVAEAGISLGVIALAAVALIPGRKPPM